MGHMLRRLPPALPKGAFKATLGNAPDREVAHSDGAILPLRPPQENAFFRDAPFLQTFLEQTEKGAPGSLRTPPFAQR